MGGVGAIRIEDMYNVRMYAQQHKQPHGKLSEVVKGQSLLCPRLVQSVAVLKDYEIMPGICSIYLVGNFRDSCKLGWKVRPF